MNKEMLNKSRLFEKIEIKWFSLEETKKHIKEFRKFYQEIVNIFLSESENIYQFALKKSKKNNNKTQKNMQN